MLQSLSPLAFLTIVRNFKFTPVSELAENQSYWGEFVRLNNVPVSYTHLKLPTIA